MDTSVLNPSINDHSFSFHPFLRQGMPVSDSWAEFWAPSAPLELDDRPEIDQPFTASAQSKLIGEIEQYIRQLTDELRSFIMRFPVGISEEEDAIDSTTIFYLPPNEMEEVLVEVHDVGPAMPTIPSFVSTRFFATERLSTDLVKAPNEYDISASPFTQYNWETPVEPK